MSMKAFYDNAAEIIAKVGWTVVGVFPVKDGDTPFAYTIGLHGKGLPELLVFRLDPKTAQLVLNAAARLQIDRGEAFMDGEIVLLPGGALPVKWRDASNPETRVEWTIQAGQYWRTQDYQVRQMLVPDKTGRWPDGPNCASPYCDVPMPGRRMLQ